MTTLTINPIRLTGTKGRMNARNTFTVNAMIPDKKHPGFMTEGPAMFSGTREECEKFLQTHQQENRTARS